MSATLTQYPAARRGFLHAAAGNGLTTFKRPAYPCPFCRSAMTWRDSFLLRRQVYLGCETCGAKSPRGDTKAKVLFQFDIPLLAAALKSAGRKK